MRHTKYNLTTQDNLKLYVQEWSPEGAVKGSLMLVHGLGEHSGRYAHVAEALTSKGYSLTAFDLRGHGKSEGIRGHATSYPALMNDITQNINLVREHFPGSPIFLYGHSIGGNFVLYYCLTQKTDIKGAIVTAPALGTANPVPLVKLTLGKLLYNLLPSTQMDNGLDRSGLSRDPEVEKKYSSDPLVHPKVSARLALDTLNNGRFIIDHAHEFPIPLLMMQGSADRIVSLSLTSKITFKEWEGCYHELHNEPEKQEVLKFIADWLDQELK
jgi:acylglycerol lipase